MPSTRIGPAPSEANDPLTASYPLAAETIAAFQADGHVLLREVLARDDVAHLAPALRDTARRLQHESRPLAERDTYGRAFLQAINLWRADDTARSFVLARRFAAIAARLLGVERVRLYHDQALFTEGGGGITPWHQDQAAWPLGDARALTMWMALADIDERMGTLDFVPGSHRLKRLADLPICDEGQDFFSRLIDERGLAIRRTGAMRAGDATFHLGWTIHGAQANASAHAREAMTVIYVADGARIGDADHPLRAASLERWFAGRVTGDAVDGDLHPLLG